VRISGSNAGYTMFRGSVKSTGYRLHSPVSPSLPLPCVTVCHHISTGIHTDSHKTGKCSVYCAFMWRAVAGRFFQCSHISLSLIISRTLSGNSLSEGDSILPFPSLCEIPRRIICYRLTLARNSKVMSSTRSVSDTNHLPNRKANP
jgi:hypothetical protein